MRLPFLLLLPIALVATSCAPPPAGTRDESTTASRPAVLKRIKVAITGDPSNFSSRFNPGGIVPGVSEVQAFLNSGLSVTDPNNVVWPRLGEVVPTLENGLWKLFPDGRMETNWKIRADARWHDGQPLTAEDLLFTMQIDQDAELPVARSTVYASIEGVETPDPLSILVRWRQPYIDADTFTGGLPLPRHLLGETYTENKAGFMELPYWTEAFIGAGPFKVKEFVRGSHLILAANDLYVLGRPRIDEVEVRFIPDFGTLAANILAGEVELPLAGGRLTLEWATQVRDQWRDGRMELARTSLWFTIWPQFLAPSPPLVANVQFRRALLHATNRDLLSETVLQGLVPAAHSIVSPKDPEYQYVESSVVRYEYDPRRAMQMVEALGYRRSPDGAWQDATGQRLSVQLRTITAETQQRLTLSIVDLWRQIGIDAQPDTIPTQLAGNPEYYATFPSFLLIRSTAGWRGIRNLRSNLGPVPENRFTGNNYGRYRSEELDRLIDGIMMTIPLPERMELVGQAVRHIGENLNTMGMVYNAAPALIANRLANVGPEATWNIHEWDVH